MIKKCFKCLLEKNVSQFYPNHRMKDGYLNKCKDCTKIDCSTKNGKETRNCFVCKKDFKTRITEINRGGGICCSRACYFIRFNSIVKKDKDSPNWKGNKVGKGGLHSWVKKHLGTPNKCEHCNTTTAKCYDWANKSQTYKRDLTDWIRLCRSCHAKYDHPFRQPKWKESVKKLGWKTF